jgi:uncharacterized protein (DUF1800 family)
MPFIRYRLKGDIFMSSITQSAYNRFGLGASTQQDRSLSDPRAWLKQQLTQMQVPSTFAALPNSLSYLKQEQDYRQEKAMAKRDTNKLESSNNSLTKKELRKKFTEAAGKGSANLFRDATQKEIAARMQHAITTQHDFNERLTYFWSNHFAVSIDKRAASLYAAPMEREAIRPYLNGSFSDMLLAVTQHPAMLLYLDNARSVGEDSKFVASKQKNPKRASGLNENLAREILELHTLGVNAGYTQTDVTEFARALTGWSVPRRQNSISANASFAFYEATHEPGNRRVLSKEYHADGVEQGKRILHDLAMHPATAKHLAFKLARHFVSDAPPAAMVDRMASAYLKHQSQLEPMYHAMIDSEEAWSAQARKFKTPTEFIISAFRSTDTSIQGHEREVHVLLERMGHLPFMSRSPEGYGDTLADWSGPDALFKRLQAAGTLAEWAPRNHTAFDVAKLSLGAALDKETITAIQRAESSHQALSLLFACPAFQWRV